MIEIQEMLENSKDELAKAYINEAIQCYDIGAYRACINLTWQAVYVNIVYKIKSLSLQDTNAQNFIKTLEQLIENQNGKQLSAIESDILDIDKQGINIITKDILVDLKRLKEDRNRCSHPNININDEAYIPSKDLTKSHLHNAVEKFISQENIYGKNFYQKVIEKIISTNFPEKYDDCVVVLKNHYLSRPNNALVKKLVEEIIRNIIMCSKDKKILSAYLNTLKYLLELNREYSEKNIVITLNNIISEPSNNLQNIHHILSVDNNIFCRLSESSKITLQRHIENTKDIDNISYFSSALELKDTISNIIQNELSAKELRHISLKDAQPEIKQILINKYLNSGSFDTANSLANSIVEILQDLDKEKVSEFLVKAYRNSQITASHEFDRTLLPNLKDKFSDDDLKELEKQAQEELRRDNDF